MIKLVHYKPGMGGKWEVGILLECFLVTLFFLCFLNPK